MRNQIECRRSGWSADQVPENPSTTDHPTDNPHVQPVHRNVNLSRDMETRQDPAAEKETQPGRFDESAPYQLSV